MDFPEPYAHSFIIKVWLEETADEAGQAIWRGRITHVPSGEYRYFEKLKEAATFIAAYLHKLGASPEEV